MDMNRSPRPVFFLQLTSRPGRSFSGHLQLALALCFMFGLACTALARGSLTALVTPAATGEQLVRIALPLPAGFLREGESLTVSDGHTPISAAVRELTWHPIAGRESRSVRRALVTFPWQFPDRRPVEFQFRPAKPTTSPPSSWPLRVELRGESIFIAYGNGVSMEAKLRAPPRSSSAAPLGSTVESNACYLWQRYRLDDPNWPRLIDVRADCLGGVVVQGQLQRGAPGDSRAPEFGWEFSIRSPEPGAAATLLNGTQPKLIGASPITHYFSNAAPASLDLCEHRYRLDLPTAPFKRRGALEARAEGTAIHGLYLACTEAEKVPMQLAAWRRAELVFGPATLAPSTPTLRSSHQLTLHWRVWDNLYGSGAPLELSRWPELAGLLAAHHEWILRSQAHGGDWGNITAFSEGSSSGAVFGMNRLNHCAPIFEEGYRQGDDRLIDAAVAWCDNFYDQSIWWGPQETGGTRYNNLAAMGGQSLPDNANTYMWRSTNSVSFCTKGYDAFFYAYEETGDPRMQEALDAQVAYASKHLHAGAETTRNVGDVRDFLHLYRFTGKPVYLAQAERLFSELRTQLSTGNLFTESGKPIAAVTPFIDEDKLGYEFPFAKPYILGYALAGLPELTRYQPREPKLETVVRAVADFLAASQDPLGGWRYPHPHSSRMILSQAMEHAWQLRQADRYLKPQEKHLDAIERVLRQRYWGWRKSGRLLGGLAGWETATGKIKQADEIRKLYAHPADRDPARDYTEGQPEFGSSGPEGIVYFPDVLAFYLQHRPASRLLTPPQPEEPLAKVLARSSGHR